MEEQSARATPCLKVTVVENTCGLLLFFRLPPPSSSASGELGSTSALDDLEIASTCGTGKTVLTGCLGRKRWAASPSCQKTSPRPEKGTSVGAQEIRRSISNLSGLWMRKVRPMVTDSDRAGEKTWAPQAHPQPIDFPLSFLPALPPKHTHTLEQLERRACS